MSTLPVKPVVEVYVNGVGWVDVAAAGHVRQSTAASGGGIEITRGTPNEGSSAEPTQVNFTLNNIGGQYSPKNPNSPYYGKMGRNTPVRVGRDRRVDSFASRTVVSGWGAMSDGLGSWTLVTITPSAFNVSGGFGTILATAANRLVVHGTYADVDQTVTVKVSDRLTEFGMVARSNNVDSWYTMYITCAADDLIRIGNVQPSNTFAYATTFSSLGIPNIVAGTLYKMQMQVTDNRVRGRIWLATDPPPTAWHVFAFIYNDATYGQVPKTGSCGVFVHGGSTTTASFKDYQADNWRAHAEIAELPPSWDLSQTDRWVSIKARGLLRRYGQGRKALESPVTRHLSSYSGSALWLPLEVPGSDVRVINRIPGGAQAPAAGLTYGAEETVPGIAAMATLTEDTSFIMGQARRHPATNAWSILFFIKVPNAPASDIRICTIRTSGTAVEWRITLQSNVAIRIDAVNSDGTIISTGPVGLLFYFNPEMPQGSVVACTLYQFNNGSNINWAFNYHRPGASDFWTTGTQVVAGRVGQFKSIRFQSSSAHTAAGNMSVGQVFHYPGDLPFVTDAFARAAYAYIGELASIRFLRLCSEVGVRAFWFGNSNSDNETMGPQLPLKFVELIQDCADSSGAILMEERQELAISMRYRKTLYNQLATVLDLNAGHLSDPLAPNDDDQNTRNDVTVTGSLGGSASSIQLTGPLNVNPPETDPDGVGTYDESVEYNVSTPEQLQPIANWRRGEGTIPDARYPSMHIDLTATAYLNNADMAAQAANLDSGSLVSLINPQVTPDPVEQLVQSYTETMDEYDLDMTIVTKPARLYRVGALRRTTRIGTKYSVTHASFITGTNTALQVHRTDTAVGFLWVLPADQAAAFPFDILVAGVRLRVTSVSGTSDPQTLTCQLIPVNGIVKTIPALTPVVLFEPWRVAW